MKVFDLKKTLKKCIEQGFPLSTISKITDISECCLRGILDGENDSTLYDNKNISFLFIFLTQLYDTDILDNRYILSLIDSLENYFKIPRFAIANYLEIDKSKFDLIMQKEKFDTDTKIKIMHLFCAFVRDKQYSITELF